MTSESTHRRAWRALRLGLACTVAASALGAEDLSVAGLNRTFEGFVSELAPITVGPAVVGLTSPEHRLVIAHHAAEVAPDPLGGHRVTLELVFSGWGLIEADVELGAMESHLSDELTVPRQTLVLTGRVAIEPASSGYVIRALELPESVRVRIESKLAGRLVGLCRPMALVLVGLDCGALESALSSVIVPLPRPGVSYLLEYSELSAVERRRYQDYLNDRGSGAGR